MMLIGRKVEIQRLEKLYNSKEAEFAVLYGRRRVGKTYLIRQFFKDKKCQFFQATGVQKGLLTIQIKHFTESLSETFSHGIELKPPSSWEDALRLLTQLIEKTSPENKIILFLDELPWMATRRSGLLEALDYYWNHHWSKNSNIILVVCGSSASWLIKNIINNKGGLHNRCTCEIQLDPFTLIESHDYLKYKSINLNKRHVLDLYMALGGIPYYLKYVEAGLTAAKNIQRIFFDKQAPLKDEFKKLFESLFTEASIYIELIKLIANRKEGISRSELEEKSKLTSGGRLTQRLNQMVQTSFIEAHIPWDKKRGEYYKVVDEFCLFYMYWLNSSKLKKFTSEHWLKQIQKPVYHVWAGYAFEAICHKHTSNIIKALNITSAEAIHSWRFVPRTGHENGAQIDLLIDRNDDAITICEIKYTENFFSINKSYFENLKRKIEIFKGKTLTKKQIFLCIISANGIKETSYSKEIVSGVVTLDDFFK